MKIIVAKIAPLSISKKYLASSHVLMVSCLIFNFNIGIINLLWVGQEWRDLRKPLDKLLTKKMVESNLEMFHDTALKVCKVISKHAEKGETFNIRRNLTDYGIDTLCGEFFFLI